jgi:hypothetical protein
VPLQLGGLLLGAVCLALVVSAARSLQAPITDVRVLASRVHLVVLAISAAPCWLVFLYRTLVGISLRDDVATPADFLNDVCFPIRKNTLLRKKMLDTVSRRRRAQASVGT